MRQRVTDTKWLARQAGALPQSSLQHHKWLQNTWVYTASTMGYYGCAEHTVRTKINFQTDFKVAQTSKQTKLHMYFWQWLLFFVINIRGSHDFASQTYTDTHVSVCEVVSRPRQRQEIPWDVFNKNGQRQPENWQMKTCWSAPQRANNTLSTTMALLHSSADYSYVFVFDFSSCVAGWGCKRERIFLSEIWKNIYWGFYVFAIAAVQSV